MNHAIHFRVLYADTDQMGIMHHSNYLKYFEAARHELLKSLEVAYSQVENKGIIMPVIQAHLKYIKPAYYDQLITVETEMICCKGARIVFEALMLNPAREIISTSTITLATVCRDSRKACHPPAAITGIFSDKAIQNS